MYLSFELRFTDTPGTCELYVAIGFKKKFGFTSGLSWIYSIIYAWW